MRGVRRPCALVLLLAGVLGTVRGAHAGSEAAVGVVPRALSEALAQQLSERVRRELPDVLALYRDLHMHPELSLAEHRTAARVARELEAAGYAVTTGVGGTGVVGVLANGDGPIVLMRGDMDGLPVTEATGLDYASQAVAQQADGSEVGVMHACGHDVHTANLIATARLLSDLRDGWSGTLIAVAQPAEEIGRGALAMLDDGLFERFPRPEAVIALHVDADIEAGAVGIVPGWAAANVDSVDVTLHGRGGHGARPHQTVDPIVVGAHFVTALQTLVSRRLDPIEPAVVTVGSFHAGSKHNVIPDEAQLQLTVRSYSDEARALLLDGIRQIAEDTCETFRCPRPPSVVVKDEYTPAVYNDPDLSAAAGRVFGEVIGAERVLARKPAMGGEDFGRYSRVLGVPGLQYRLGSVDPKRVAAAAEPGGEPLPSLHSSRFAPLPEPTLRTAMTTLSALALSLLGPPDGAP